jgi:hypothetical protein
LLVAVTAENVGITLVAIVLLGFLAYIGAACLYGGYEIIKVGGLGARIAGSVFLLLGLVATCMTVSGFASIGGVLHRLDKTQNYQERIIVVSPAGTTIESICTRYRPTWSENDCQARIHEHNRAVDLQHLQAGDKIYLDINIGHKGNGDERTEIDYKKSTVALSPELPTLAAICGRYRPTWRHPYCESRIREYNLLPKLGMITIGTKVELPATI